MVYEEIMIIALYFKLQKGIGFLIDFFGWVLGTSA